MALDEPKDDDEKLPEGKLTFLVEPRISATIPEIKIDYKDSFFGKGFVVNAAGNGTC